MTEVTLLQSRIEAALDQRGRHYSGYYSFHIRFEADDTSAEKDNAHFQLILNILGLPAAEELVIKANDKIPGWTVTGFLVQMMQSRATKTSRALVIGHYAGHAGVDDRDQLYFVAGPSHPARIFYDTSIGRLLQPSEVPPETDVCLILYACYSGVATRTDEACNWTAELMAAVGPQQKAFGNWSALARVRNRTFTSRLADEVARELGRGVSAVSFADIIATLRKKSTAEPTPIYLLKAGASGIRIPNLENNTSIAPHLRVTTQQQRRKASVSAPSSSSSALSPMISSSQEMLPPSESAPGLSAVFQVHLKSVDPTEWETENLVKWLHSLSTDLGIELLGVFKAQSATMLF